MAFSLGFFVQNQLRASSTAVMAGAILVLASSGCLRVVAVQSPVQDSGIEPVFPDGQTVSLLSSRITRWKKAKVRVDCGNASYYAAVAEGADAPAADASDWLACGARTFDAIVSLPEQPGKHALTFPPLAGGRRAEPLMPAGLRIENCGNPLFGTSSIILRRVVVDAFRAHAASP